MSSVTHVPLDGAHSPDYRLIRGKLANELSGYLTELKDFNQSLKAKYEIEVYENFEMRFRTIRFSFKNMRFAIDNEYYEYINRSEARKEQVSMVIQTANQVAKAFQDARERGRLDRVECTDYLENLIVLIQNLRAQVNPA